MRVFVALLAVLPLLGGAATVVRAGPPLSVYGQLPALEDAAISPSGDRIALIGVFDGQRRLLVVDHDTKPVFTLPLGEDKVRDLSFTGDDQVILFKSDTVPLDYAFAARKAELYSAIVIPLDRSRKLWSVFEGNRAITGGVRQAYGVASRSGRTYGYFSAITLDGSATQTRHLTNTRPVLYEVDLGTGAARAVGARTQEGVFRSWKIGAGGEIAATLDFISRSGSWTVRNAAGDAIATGTSKMGDIDLVGLGQAGKTLIFREKDDDGGEDHLREIPLEGGPASEMLAGTAVERFLFDRATHRLIGYASGGENRAYHFLDARRQKVIDATLKAFPGRVVSLIGWNDGFDKLLVATEGGDDPRSLWLVDIRTGSANLLGQSYFIPPEAVAPVQMVRYKAGDGTVVAAVLTLPPGRTAKKLPTIILPHGGPAAHDRVGFDWWAQALASRGYAVLQPNFRGSTGYGAAFLRAGDGEWGRKMQSDISDGLAFLAREGIADPRRACIMGASYGGYAALAGVTLQQGIYRCAVSFAGVSDMARLASTARSESGGDPALTRGLRRQLGSGRSLDEISPIRLADRAAAPILLIHGQDDTIVRYEQSSAMAAALRRANKPVELVTLAGEDHWLSKAATRLAMLQAAVAFVERHNPPDASGAAVASTSPD